MKHREMSYFDVLKMLVPKVVICRAVIQATLWIYRKFMKSWADISFGCQICMKYIKELHFLSICARV